MSLIVPKPFLWVAFPGSLGGYKQIIELAKRLGFGGIAPRAGQGLPNGSFRASLFMQDITAIVNAGLECHPWVYSYPAAVDSEVACAWRCQDAGATSFIIDAEAPWDIAGKGLAARYGDSIKRHLTIPVYDAPWPWIDYHPGYPEKEFRWVDGRMLQTYWTEIGVSMQHCLDKAKAQWSGKDDRIMPIGITYGRKEIAKWGTQQLPPGEIDTASVLAACPSITGGWYSAEAAGPGVLDVIAGTFGTLECATEQPDNHAIETHLERDEEECATFYCRNRDIHDNYLTEIP